jgi:DNA polymerase-3 subunit delta
MAKAKAGPAAGVHAVLGGRVYDSFLADQHCQRVVEAAVGAGSGDALTVLRGEETSWARLCDELRTGSLFAPKRAVVVRNADALKGDGAEVESYLDDPTPGVTLVLLASKVDKRKNPWKRIADRAEVFEAEPPKGRGLYGWVAAEARRQGVVLRDEGLQEIVDRLGQDLRRISGEIEKLAAFADGAKGPMSAEDVAAVLGRGVAQPVYKLTDAVAERNVPEALRLLEALLDDRGAEFFVMSALHRAIRQVRATSALKARRASRDEMVAQLGLPANMAFKLPALVEAAGRWQDGELRGALAVLAEADARLKSGAEPRAVLTAALVKACGRRGEGTRPSPRPSTSRAR